jgi:hypothetical protein
MNLAPKKILSYLLLLFCLAMPNQKMLAQKIEEKSKGLIVRYKDTINKEELTFIKKSFNTYDDVYDYIKKLPKLLQSKGYLTASVDTILQLENDIHIILYVGELYDMVHIRTKNISPIYLAKAGYEEKDFLEKPITFNELNTLKENLFNIYENNGYPFTTLVLDSIEIDSNKITGILTANTFLLYKIDSIVNFGTLKLNARFLQRYLGIKNNSIYNKEKLKDVDRLMLELPFAETINRSSLNLLGSGAILNLNVNSKKSSEASAIFGFLPAANNTNKLQVTGDLNLDLKNVFGAGEGLILKYQALQPKSPRLNIGYDKPYIFNSPFGFNFMFEFFKKDSSFLQINVQTGVQLNLKKYQTGKLFFQWQKSNLLEGAIDTTNIKLQKSLPNIIDVKSANTGFYYEYQKTNYRFNPLKGTIINIVTTIGIKTIEKNNDVLSIKDPTFNPQTLYDSIKLKSYQLRLKIAATRYTKLSKTSTIKTALNIGLYNSPSIFRNDVFQIGGYKLLRGFDEESIYVSTYGVSSVEYRSLLSQNSYLFGFVDAALTNTKYLSINTNNFFIGSGLGIVYETKAGLLNLSIALGKRNDVPFNIRQATKIHFGYINYF